MKLKKIFGLLALLFMGMTLSCTLTACGGDEPDHGNSGGNSGSSTETREIRPVVKLITDASTTDEFTVAFRVKSVRKPSVTLYWSAEKKTSSPKYNRSSSVTRTYDEVKLHSSNATEYYYKVTHAGFSPGDYVYYKIVASNSAGDDTAKGYVIIKR